MSTTIDTAAFFRAHFRQPKGDGVWGFEIARRVQYANGSAVETAAVFTPRAMSFTEAKVWIRHKVRGQHDVESVSVAA